MLEYLGANIKENFIEEEEEFIHEVIINGDSVLQPATVDLK